MYSDCFEKSALVWWHKHKQQFKPDTFFFLLFFFLVLAEKSLSLPKGKTVSMYASMRLYLPQFSSGFFGNRFLSRNFPLRLAQHFYCLSLSLSSPPLCYLVRTEPEIYPVTLCLLWAAKWHQYKSLIHTYTHACTHTHLKCNRVRIQVLGFCLRF